MINRYRKNKRVDEAMSLFKEMLCRNLTLNTVTYNSLIDGLCKSGRISYVQEFLDQMHASGHHPDILTYNILLDSLCKSQHLDEAIDFFQQVVGKGICASVITCTILIDGLCKGGRLKTTQEFFQHLLIKCYQLDVKVYTTISMGFVKRACFNEAMALLSKMDDNDCSPDDIAAFIIIQALLDKNENEKAEKLLHQMIELSITLVLEIVSALHFNP